jgi:DNA-binding response OmpR family regulator
MTQPGILITTLTETTEKDLEHSFSAAGFVVSHARDVVEAMHCLRRQNPRALLIDWDLYQPMAGDINRVLQDACKKTALVVLSRQSKPLERIHALEEGADDYLGQSEGFDELVAKVKALIRRIDRVDHTPRIIRIKDIEIHLDSHEVFQAGKPVDLTYTQFRLLYLLVTHRETVFSREEILEKVWGENVYVTDRTVDVHVKRLREKLGEKSHPSRYIQTIHGLGYRFA